MYSVMCGSTSGNTSYNMKVYNFTMMDASTYTITCTITHLYINCKVCKEQISKPVAEIRLIDSSLYSKPIICFPQRRAFAAFIRGNTELFFKSRDPSSKENC